MQLQDGVYVVLVFSLCLIELRDSDYFWGWWFWMDLNGWLEITKERCGMAMVKIVSY